jgi:hypothetical protein
MEFIMSLDFEGHGMSLDMNGLASALDILNVGAAERWAVQVETGGVEFLPDRRPDILYERHIFSRLTNPKQFTNVREIILVNSRLRQLLSIGAIGCERSLYDGWKYGRSHDSDPVAKYAGAPPPQLY